jgi:hypothetical protein
MKTKSPYGFLNYRMNKFGTVQARLGRENNLQVLETLDPGGARSKTSAEQILIGGKLQKNQGTKTRHGQRRQQEVQEDPESCYDELVVGSGRGTAIRLSVSEDDMKVGNQGNLQVESNRVGSDRRNEEISKRIGSSLSSTLSEGFVKDVDAQHNGNTVEVDDSSVMMFEEAKLQQTWNIVGSNGKALRRSNRRQKEKIEKTSKNAKFTRVNKITTNNKATANNKKTTNNNNNYSNLQTNKKIKNKNKKFDRINNKEQIKKNPKEVETSRRSPMLLDLDKAISRAQILKASKEDVLLSESRNPIPKNEEDRTSSRSYSGSNKSGTLEVDSEGEMSVETVGSKKSYASATSSPRINDKKSDIFNEQHAVKIEAEHRNRLQLQQQNLLKNNVIRQSKRLSGEYSNFFEYDNKRNVNVVQQNKKVKIDIEDIEVLEKMESKKLINKTINNIMKNNNRNNNQNIRLNHFRKVGTNSANKYKINKNNVNNNNKINKNNVNNNNNINKFNNNKSFHDKDEDERSRSSEESDGSDAEKRFLKNRLLIYDDIIITYNRITNDEKSLLNANLSVEPISAFKQNVFVNPLPITNTSPSDKTVAKKQ